MRMNAARMLASAICASAAVLIPLTAYAAWPDDKPIKIIVAQPPGGTNDTVARLLGDELSKALGQTFVVENRPGATGSIGMQMLALSAPDGYTLGIASDSTAILSATRENLPWRLNKDMRGVSMIADQPIAVAVSKHTSYKTVDQLLEAARAQPNHIAFGTSGLGTAQHIVGEWLASLANVKMMHIPYKGGGQAITDLVGGVVPAAVLGFVPILGQYRADNVRVLAVTTGRRNSQAPDVPTLKELGYGEIETAQWVGFVAPADTPTEVVQRVSDAIGKIVSEPRIQSKLAEIGLDAQFMQANPFDEFLNEQVDHWSSLTKRLELDLH